MRYDPEKHHRHSIRLRGYDYAQAGMYFVTIVAMNRECLFGEIADGKVRLNANGNIVRSSWDDLSRHYANVQLDAFVVMPNHIHGIILLTGDDARVGAGRLVGAGPVGAGLRPAPTHHALPEIVRAFKSFSSRRINETRKTTGAPVWQRNYYEHIIRNEMALHAVREYIANNPIQWLSDTENPIVWKQSAR